MYVILIVQEIYSVRASPSQQRSVCAWRCGGKKPDLIMFSVAEGFIIARNLCSVQLLL